jgi:molybdopterin-guanine dinucleotide biosynthesis protein A
MGCDKALLELEGSRLVLRVAGAVAAAAGSCTLIGDPEKYGALGYPVCADIFPGCGPLAGIHAALSASAAEWNLIVACDMPDIEPRFLQDLMAKVERNDADCILPAGESGRPEPLCGVWRRRALPTVQRALESGIRKVLDGLAGLHLEVVRVDGPGPFRNINTPREWIEYRGSQTDKTPHEGN